MPHALTWHHPMSYRQAFFSNGAVFIAVLDDISDLLLGNMEHQIYFIILVQYYTCCYGDFLPPLEKKRSTLFHLLSLFLLPLLGKASISNVNNYKNQTISAVSVPLSCSFRRLCSTSPLPVGNYLFPVVIIIHQHAADPLTNTSHFHLQLAGCPQLPAAPSVPPTPIAWCRGQRDRPLSTGWRWRETTEKEMRQGKKEKVGWAEQWKMDQHPPTYTHTHSVPSASLVKWMSAGKDLRLVNDGYLSNSDAACSVSVDSLQRRCWGRKHGTSSLSSHIRVED